MQNKNKKSKKTGKIIFSAPFYQNIFPKSLEFEFKRVGWLSEILSEILSENSSAQASLPVLKTTFAI